MYNSSSWSGHQLYVVFYNETPQTFAINGVIKNTEGWFLNVICDHLNISYAVRDIHSKFNENVFGLNVLRQYNATILFNYKPIYYEDLKRKAVIYSIHMERIVFVYIRRKISFSTILVYYNDIVVLW